MKYSRFSVGRKIISRKSLLSWSKLQSLEPEPEQKLRRKDASPNTSSYLLSACNTGKQPENPLKYRSPGTGELKGLKLLYFPENLLEEQLEINEGTHQG
ncbi:hypothetical protein AQV86_04405 [Nanohaloarchaea archaeon SG9]|nr:hypothetical protein AQV86_04405 [Nanohaloarchaea archaeon SG9]